MTAEGPDPYPPIGFFGPVRFIIRIAAMVVLLGLCLIVHYGWRLAGRPSPWPPRFLWGIVRICNVRLSIEGNRLEEKVFYVSNHLSWLDIPILGGATRAAFVAHDGIAKWPIIGWLAKINKTVFVARSDRFSVAEQIATLREALEGHQPVTIFPEGTTTDGTTLLPFKPPLFEVLTTPLPGIRVQPVLLDFYGRGAETAWVGDESALHNAWRMLCRRKPIAARVVFLAPFDPAQCNDRKEIAATAREQVRRALTASLGGQAVL